MSATPSFVLGQGSSPAEDDLRLPRPPGVIRRFWGRHPLLADILIAIAALLLSLPGLSLSARSTHESAGGMIALAIVLTIAGCLALVWRRRAPIAVLAVALLLALVVDPALASAVAGPATLIALYSVAVYRGVRACWIAFGVAVTVLGLNGLARIMIDPTQWTAHLNVVVSTIVLLLLGALVGVNVGNRRRYLEALIDRSRQLVIERDQQARLAAAAERTRIAREMHDIVSHSLTVVVALADGASATADPERSREASRAIAATARDALGEMRGMLGVLRSDSVGADAPLRPLLTPSLHDIVESARAAGFPIELTVSGRPEGSAPYQLALRRIVQEGITNAMRHSPDATFIRATTAYSTSGVRIVVENDGAHVSTDAAPAGWGLQGLRERVAHRGGTLTAGMSGPATWRLDALLPAEVSGA